MALQRLGPFELIRVLGRGGMGTVYEAREDGSDELVAVKALAPQFSFDERFRHRFEGEIDALMKLEHPNIVRLLSYGQDEGNLYFAMELVDGCSLFQEQKKGQVFHWREIVDIGVQVCGGLRHAHDRGIIHRDLKPGNLMIDGQRCVKIADFGIAKSFGASSVTREGNVLGTMDFMAPEQARGQAVTVRSDLFSLGAVLYSLLAGRPPFLQETVDQTFESLLSPDPPVRLNKIARDTPAPLAFLIHRLLEKDPENRLATAMATARQLQHVEEAVKELESETQVVPPDGGDDEFEIENTISAATSIRSDAVPADEPAPSQLDTRYTEVGEKISDKIAKQPDYFNEVTPQQRQKTSVADLETEETRSSAWPLVVALVIVLGVSAWGVWYRLIRTPPANELLASIEASEGNPNRVRDELLRFQKIYPNHERIAWVDELLRYSDALKFRNTLKRDQRSPQVQLSEIAEQFLEITDMPDTAAPQAAERMAAFLKFHEDSQSLGESDERVIEMARVFQRRIENEARLQISRGINNITEAMERAKRSSSKADKLDIYRFVVEMYGDDRWADELVDECRQKIKELEPSESPASTGSPPSAND